MNKPKFAIIGAGLSGLIVARKLSEFGEVKIFEKARGVGGRMASRYFKNNSESNSDSNKNDFGFDFGAQFFNAKSREFKSFIQPFITDGTLVEWHARFVEIDNNKITYRRNWGNSPEHYVVAPKMNELCKKLAKNLDIKFQTKITKLIKTQNSISISDDKENLYEDFDLVILAIPAQQTLELIPENYKFRTEISTKKMVGCFALMLGLESEMNIDFDAAYLKNSKLSWIASEDSKPNRMKSFSYSILSRNAWAEKNMERDLNEIKNELIEELEYATNSKLPKILHSDIHRWRYANIAKQAGEKFYFDKESKIAACGDWCIKGRIEAAFLSATLLANQIQQS